MCSDKVLWVRCGSHAIEVFNMGVADPQPLTFNINGAEWLVLSTENWLNYALSMTSLAWEALHGLDSTPNCPLKLPLSLCVREE